MNESKLTRGHIKTADQCNRWTHQQLTSPVHNVKTWKWGDDSLAIKALTDGGGGENNIWLTVNEERIDWFYGFSSCTITRKQLQVKHTVSCIQLVLWHWRRWAYKGESCHCWDTNCSLRAQWHSCCSASQGENPPHTEDTHHAKRDAWVKEKWFPSYHSHYITLSSEFVISCGIIWVVKLTLSTI